ncbi:hypothetical protein chiPu_0030336, partial [Chiloscyllium punctatum]|nr:hypothetical protein [Chiloscyllium punctatum]
QFSERWFAWDWNPGTRTRLHILEAPKLEARRMSQQRPPEPAEIKRRPLRRYLNSGNFATASG